MTAGKTIIKKINKGEKHLKKILAVVAALAFLIAAVFAAMPAAASTDIYSSGGASPEMISANQLFYGHCSK